MIAKSDHTAGVELSAVAPPSTIRTYNKKVMLLLPWQKNVSPITSYCVMQLHDKRRTSSLLNFGDAFVAHTRNSCTDVFLQTDLEWCLMIDDDMLVPFGNANWFKNYTGWQWFPEPFASFNAIDRLMSHGKTLVGGLYFGKHGKGPPVFNEGAANSKEADFVRTCPIDLVKPTRWVGTGCMLIHRTVFEDIEKKFPYLARGPGGKGGQWFTSSEHTAMNWIDRTYEMLSKGPMDGNKAMKAYEMLTSAKSEARANSSLGMGEDVTLCVRAGEAGHQPHIDLGLVCGHIGNTIYGPRNTVTDKK